MNRRQFIRSSAALPISVAAAVLASQSVRAAANDVQIRSDSPITIGGGTTTIALSMEGLSDSAGRVSAQYDRGAGVLPAMFLLEGFTQWQATPTQNGSLGIYLLSYNDSSNPPGDVGTSDAALGSVDQLINENHQGDIVVETADTTKMVMASRLVFLFGRYLQTIVYNAGGSALNATDSNSQLQLTPMQWQLQSS